MKINRDILNDFLSSKNIKSDIMTHSEKPTLDEVEAFLSMFFLDKDRELFNEFKEYLDKLKLDK